MNPLETIFPNLVGTDYRVTSPADDEYNCIAWAATESARWWWPDSHGTNYWPDGVTRAVTPEAFTAAYATVGFTPTGCRKDRDLSEGWKADPRGTTTAVGTVDEQTRSRGGHRTRCLHWLAMCTDTSGSSSNDKRQ